MSIKDVQDRLKIDKASARGEGRDERRHEADMIERAERAAGCRVDDPDNDTGYLTLLGAVARAMGKNPHGERGDYAAGALLAHQPRYAGKEMMTALLRAEVPPDFFRRTADE